MHIFLVCWRHTSIQELLICWKGRRLLFVSAVRQGQIERKQYSYRTSRRHDWRSCCNTTHLIEMLSPSTANLGIHMLRAKDDHWDQIIFATTRIGVPKSLYAKHILDFHRNMLHYFLLATVFGVKKSAMDGLLWSYLLQYPIPCLLAGLMGRPSSLWSTIISLSGHVVVFVCREKWWTLWNQVSAWPSRGDQKASKKRSTQIEEDPLEDRQSRTTDARDADSPEIVIVAEIVRGEVLALLRGFPEIVFVLWYNSTCPAIFRQESSYNRWKRRSHKIQQTTTRHSWSSSPATKNPITAKYGNQKMR